MNIGGYVAYSTNVDNTTNAPQAKIVSFIHQSDRGEEAFFAILAGWNRLGIDLTDRGVVRFVKYVSSRAKSDR